MSGARSLTGRLSAKADYIDELTDNPTTTDWDIYDDWILEYKVPIYGGGSDVIVTPLSARLTGVYGGGVSMKYQIQLLDGDGAFIHSSSWTAWGDTKDAEALVDNDVSGSTASEVYYINYRVARMDDGRVSRTHLTDCTLVTRVAYNDIPVTQQTLPDDWFVNTTNTIADKFVPFETVTTPIDSDDVGGSVDEFKDFLEGVQEHETLATVFMGYVSELLRLKGITAFLCFAICCMTMIAIFELSGG